MEKISKNHKTWIEIDTKALRSNYAFFRKVVDRRTKIMAVVKSNAYGHDIIKFSKEMQKLGADFLGVDDAHEALLLRKEKITKPILVFGYVEEKMIPKLVRENISITISHFETLRRILKYKNAKIHLKVDTGLGRQGFLLHDLPKVLDFLADKNISLEGLYSHLSVADDPKKLAYTKQQANELRIWQKECLKHGLHPITHISSSSGVILDPNLHFDMVRIGIDMYGLWASKEMERKFKNITLKPVLSWKSIISEIKILPKGSFVGYGQKVRLAKETKVGIVPVGYWHGYSASLTGRNVGILIRGNRAKIIGRICMDMMIVDLSKVPDARFEDEVVLVGSSGNKTLKIDDLDYPKELINYEFATRLNPQIPRIYK